MPKTVIHVNSKIARRNVKMSEHEPPIAVRQGRSGKATYAHKVAILDAKGDVVAWVISDPDHPMKCGATIAIHCEHGANAVNYDDPMPAYESSTNLQYRHVCPRCKHHWLIHETQLPYFPVSCHTCGNHFITADEVKACPSEEAPIYDD